MPDTTGSPAPLAIVNARVWTNDPLRPWADALLVVGERILAVGSSAALRKRAGSMARVVDAGGRLVLPSGAGAMLTGGAPASLVILERRAHDAPVTPDDLTDAIFSLVDGRIEIDRESLAR